MLELTDATFQSKIDEDNVTVVDFWAPWCGPCRMLAPVFEEVSASFEGRATFSKINIDDNSDAASKHGVRSIPTLMIFKKGVLVDTKTGLISKEDLTSWVNRVVG